MSFIVIDVEADGPVPGIYSMVSFGAVIVKEGLKETFYGQVRPISEKYIPEALAVSGFSRKDHLMFDNPKKIMEDFTLWIKEHSKGQPIFISDNLAFDWQWINYYMHLYTNKNPFGFSGRRIGDIYSGMKMNSTFASKWKYLRKTKHTHHPVDDAKGNAEALLEFKKQGLKIDLH